ncbi:MAG: DNA photolyase family protein [Phycisphaerae bacterium]|nr:DNA photolyase family protein [Phycisphaerae bacterium]
MTPKRISIVWFRYDLRVADNPALTAAVRRGGPVLPVFIWAPDEEGPWPAGAASRWWLHQSLVKLAGALERLGSRLIVKRGPTLAGLRDLIGESSANAVYWNRRYELDAVERDRRIESALRADGVSIETFNGSQLFEPEEVKNQQGRPFQVFTAFWRACLKLPEPAAPTTAPRRIPAPPVWPASLALDALCLEPRIDWAGGFRTAWQLGERGAAKQLRAFLAAALVDYSTGRDRPDRIGTSRLSPHLHFGEISPRQVWHAVVAWQARQSEPSVTTAADAFRRELGWREFANQLLFHFPQTTNEPLKPQFADFPWDLNRRAFMAWQRGRTGYPIVDAGMRELWTSGWMHNRVRMIAASFLVKHLLIDWREGAAWFWDTLVDADLANNTLGWQWVAGCGADAAPYFRIFNPVLQGRNFDPDGTYVRRWVPELAKIPATWIHAPWEASPDVLAAAGVKLGENYPQPIVDHGFARQRALGALARIRGGSNVV